MSLHWLGTISRSLRAIILICGKWGKIQNSFLGVETGIYDQYLGSTLIIKWLMVEFLHKILRIFILKKIICKIQIVSKSRENFEVLFLFIFFVKYCSSFRFLKALACKMPIKHRNGSSGEYIGQNRCQSGKIFFVHH